jgi:quercetin dioxygenase-like cupin family protein
LFYNFPKDFKKLKLASGWSAHTVWGNNITFSLVTAEPNSEFSVQSHQHEHMGLILVGELEVTIGDKTKRLTKGDVYLVPSNIPHVGRTHEDKVIILDAFSAIQEDNKKEPVTGKKIVSTFA